MPKIKIASPPRLGSESTHAMKIMGGQAGRALRVSPGEQRVKEGLGGW